MSSIPLFPLFEFMANLLAAILYVQGWPNYGQGANFGPLLFYVARHEVKENNVMWSIVTLIYYISITNHSFTAVTCLSIISSQSGALMVRSHPFTSIWFKIRFRLDLHWPLES